MPTWIDISGAASAVAVYTGTTDAPLTAPLSNVANLKFHSGLPYPSVVRTESGTLNLDPVAANVTDTRPKHVLFAHGRGSTPYTYGKITSGLSQVVALQGSVPVQVGASLGASWPRVLHLGADATNVHIVEQVNTHQTFGLPALSLGWTVYVFETSAVTSDVIDITPTYLLAGQFDSRRRYMRADASGADLPVVSDTTFQVDYNAAGQTGEWRYSVNGYVIQSTGSTMAANSSFTLVKI